MEKKVLFALLFCLVYLLFIFSSVSAVYYKNMNTDDPDCTNYLRDNPSLCSLLSVDNPVGPAFTINMNSIFYKGLSTWEEPAISPNCDKTLCDNFHEEGQAVCYCGLGHCCDVLDDRDNDGEKNWIYDRGTDCDDSRAAVNTKATEDCKNGMDDDCNGLIDCEDSACIYNPVCADIASVSISLEFKTKLGESPFFDANSKRITLKPISEYLSGTEKCNGLGPFSGHFWDNNMGYGINSFAYCYKIGDPTKSYVNGEHVAGNSWEETEAEFNFYKGYKDAVVKMAGSGWYSIIPDGSYGDTGGNSFALPWGTFSLCNENPSYSPQGSSRTFIGKTATIKTELDGGYGSSNFGTAVIDLTFKNNLDEDGNGVIDYCEYFEEKGCQPNQMQEDIGVKIGELDYNLQLDDSSRLPNYFPYTYEDEKKSITLAYYFNYQRPHPKLLTKLTIMTKSPVVTYTKSFNGHLNDTENVFSIPAYDFVNDKPKSGSIDFKLLDKPCSSSAQYNSVRKVYLKADGKEIPISKDILSYKDYNDLISSIGSGASDASKWVYGRIDEASNAAGKCMEVVYKNIGEAASEYNPVELLSTFNPALSVDQTVFTIPGNKQTVEFVPELIKEANERALSNEPVAKTFNIKKDCEEWVPLHSLILKQGGEDFSVPSWILSDANTAINKYLSVRLPGGESECVLIKQGTFTGSSAPAPSSFSCGVKLSGDFMSDVASLVPDFTLPVIGMPKNCKGFEIESVLASSTAKRIDAMDKEYIYTHVNQIGFDKVDLEQVAAKTYATKEECEKPRVFVNWYPGLHLLGIIYVDRFQSVGLLNDIKSYIKKSYQGDVFDRRTLGGYEHDMTRYVKKSLNFETSSVKKSASISFGWSEGGRNAFRNVWVTYSELQGLYTGRNMPPIILGMFRFDPTHAKPSEFNDLKKLYSIISPTDLPPYEILPYYVNVFAKQNTGVAGTSNGDDREILIDFNLRGINLPEEHFGVSKPIIKVLFRIYVDCLVNSKTKSECEGYMNQAITDYQSNPSNAEELLKKNYFTGVQLSEAELSEFDEYLAISQEQYIDEASYEMFLEGLQGVNNFNKEEAIHRMLLVSKEILNNIGEPTT